MKNQKLVKFSLRRILVALDGSEHSKKAVELTLALAKKWDVEVYLIHVIDSALVRVLPGNWGIPKDPRVKYAGLCEKILDPVEDRIKEVGIKKVKRICAFGDPAYEIIKTAKKKRVDLIVMGNRGQGRFSKVFMGSVSTKVCNHAHCTCITVK